MKKVRYYFPYKIPFEAVDWDAYLSVRRSVRLLKQVQQLDDAYYMVFDYVSQQLIHSSSPTYVYSEQSDVALRHLNTRYVIGTDYYERFLNFRASALDRYAGLAEPERREWEVIYSISTGKDDMKAPPAVMIKKNGAPPLLTFRPSGHGPVENGRFPRHQCRDPPVLP